MSEGKKRVALVTGAGIGIGQGIARLLGEQGYRVAIHYTNSSVGANEVAEEIRSNGGESIVFQADLTNREECRPLVDNLLTDWGGIDLLVNNAGVTRAQPFLQTTDAQYDEMFDLNIRAYFVLAQQATPAMIDQGGGAIVNISSIHGGGGREDHVAYAATKGAVIAFTRTLAIELAEHKIRVNCVAPGIIEVPRYFDRPGYTSEVGNTWVPWGRVGTPTDIANAVAFLGSDAADFITGQTLYVDGGTQAKMSLE